MPTISLSEFSDPFFAMAFAIYAVLATLSVMAVSIGIVKWLQFRRRGVGEMASANRILDIWLDERQDRRQEAVNELSRAPSVLTRVLRAVILGRETRPADPSYAEELGRQTAIIELTHLNERMRTLDMVVNAAPLLGLLGTVVGMIGAFRSFDTSQGAVDSEGLAASIQTALWTTGLGLAIALLAYFIATWLENRIDRERSLMEALISAAIYGRITPVRTGG